MELVIDIPKHVQVTARLLGGPRDAFIRIVRDLISKQDPEKYPDSVFLFRGDRWMFEWDKGNNYLWCRDKDVWSVLSGFFGGKYDATQEFIKSQVEEHFKMKGVTPRSDVWFPLIPVEEHFKMKGVTPAPATFVSRSSLVEEHFKMKGVTPFVKYTNGQTAVEKHFKIKGVTPLGDGERLGIRVEEHFKDQP